MEILLTILLLAFAWLALIYGLVFFAVMLVMMAWDLLGYCFRITGIRSLIKKFKGLASLARPVN